MSAIERAISILYDGALSSGVQLRVGYDALNYMDTAVDDEGNATLTPTGGFLHIVGSLSVSAHLTLGTNSTSALRGTKADASVVPLMRITSSDILRFISPQGAFANTFEWTNAAQSSVLMSLGFTGVLTVATASIGFVLATSLSVSGGLTASTEATVGSTSSTEPSAGRSSILGIAVPSSTTFVGRSLLRYTRGNDSPATWFVGITEHTTGIKSAKTDMQWAGSTLVARMALTVDGALSILSSLKTGAPSGGTAMPWKFGTLVSAAVTPDTTRYLQVDVNGTAYKLIIAE